MLRQKVVLYSAPAGGTTAVSGEFPFAPQFPHFVEDGSDPLPPSYTVFQPGVTTEISYQIRVDIVRKGLRRHEKYATLPSTRSGAVVLTGAHRVG